MGVAQLVEQRIEMFSVLEINSNLFFALGAVCHVFDSHPPHKKQMFMEKIKEYLWGEFKFNNMPKYYHYFDEWFNNLTENQLLYYNAYSNGFKTPYQV